MSDIIATRTLPSVDGFDIRAHLEPDTDSTPDDSECYDAADIEAWRADCWHYVGCVVTVSRDGIDLGDASVWGMEYGTLPGAGVECDPLADAPGFTTVPRGADGKPDHSRAETPITFAYGYGVDLVAEALADARKAIAGLVAEQ